MADGQLSVRNDGEMSRNGARAALRKAQGGNPSPRVRLAESESRRILDESNGQGTEYER